jgi:alpha-beta hydrolase superfamily lysophospholipase
MRPVTFHDMFGWIHEPQHLRADVGVVLISALGRDERCAHLPYRLLAEQLATAGYPSLRYDHRGEGDSLGLSDPGTDALPCWLEGVQKAIEKLRAETNVKQVVLAGVRLGATLAAVSAAKADGLILLAPVLDARAWLKRLRFASHALGGAAREAPLDTGGLVLSMATMASLAELNMDGCPSVPVFIAAQNRMVESYGAELTERGALVTVTDFRGFDAMFLDAHSNMAPDEVFGRAIGWLTATFGEPDVASLPGGAQSPDPLRWQGASERPIEFGDRLQGIVCDPDQGHGSSAVIFCNTGGDPRSGIGGFATMAARRLANRGFASLRFDFAGLGDSPNDGPEPRTHVYEVSRAADLESAVSLMADRGAKRIVIVGICAGAFHAFESAAADPRVTDLFAVSPVKLTWRPGDSLSPGRIDDGKSTHSYVQAMISSDTWRRFISGRIDLLTVTRTLGLRLKERADGWLLRRQTMSPLSKMRRLSARGARAMFLMGLDDGSPDQMAIHFGSGCGSLKRMPMVTVRIDPKLDHGLARRESRQIALSTLLDWLG